ncbi:MAG: hypothetical protein GSR82_00425, partial [Desulfurococcales archaeon]|nr:hypothetical protein [Desulfurococcales archaeon]
VKPGNVFVNSEGRLLLGDFSGMVRLLSRTSRVSSVLPRHYTVGWRAPEQVYSDLRERALNAGVENRIDVYQLGNLLLYLLTGDSVDGEEYEEARDATGGIEDPGLRALVEKMLSPDPLDRPSVETVLSNLATVYQKLSEAEK